MAGPIYTLILYLPDHNRYFRIIELGWGTEMGSGMGLHVDMTAHFSSCDCCCGCCSNTSTVC